MKKILEVLQYGDHEFRFNTDINVKKDPEAVFKVVTDASIAMSTTLWGGNEVNVLAMIRALSIADLAVSVNRKYMVNFLDNASEHFAESLAEAKKEFIAAGGEMIEFGPGISPMGDKS